MLKSDMAAKISQLEAILEAKAADEKRADAEKGKRLSARQKISLAVGSVGIAVLALSVFHCTEALMALTGSHAVLALLLAVGIDAGMVMCEMVVIAARGDEGRKIRGWAMGYIVLAVILSCGLNGWASQHNSSEGLEVAAALVGGLIPVLVFILGKVSGMMWDSK